MITRASRILRRRLHDGGGIRTSTTAQRAAGFLGGWTAGEGLRRPVPLIDEEERRTRSGRRRRGIDGGDDGVGDDEGGVAETAEERWIRERDDWLFGRSKGNDSTGGLPPNPPPPRAPACGGAPDEGGDGGGREREAQQVGGGGGSSGGLFPGESDEVIMRTDLLDVDKRLNLGVS